MKSRLGLKHTVLFLPMARELLVAKKLWDQKAVNYVCFKRKYCR